MHINEHHVKKLISLNINSVKLKNNILIINLKLFLFSLIFIKIQFSLKISFIKLKNNIRVIN